MLCRARVCRGRLQHLQRRLVCSQHPGPPLSFTLPSLTQQEENYVKGQVALVIQADPLTIQPRWTGATQLLEEQYPSLNLAKKSISILSRNELLLRRCLSIAEAYQVDEAEMGDFLRLCESQCVKHAAFKKSRNYITFTGGHVQAVLGSSPRWLDTFRRSKYDLQETDQTVMKSDQFRLDYRERLLSVMDTCGLDEFEYLASDIECKGTSFKDFSEKFYQGLLTDICGISNPLIVNKHIKGNNRLSANRRQQIPCRDPISMVRNYHLLSNRLHLNLDTSLKHISLVRTLSPLDMLTSLNVLDALVHQDKDEGDRREKIIAATNDNTQLFIEDHFLWTWPLACCAKLLMRIGFSSGEVGDLMLQPIFKGISKGYGKKEDYGVQRDLYQITSLAPFHGDTRAFCTTMEKRLAIIRNNGVTLGIADVFDMYKFMIKWEEVIRAIDSAQVGDNPYFINFTLKPPQYGRSILALQVNVRTLPAKNKNISGSWKYLIDYLGYTNTEDRRQFNKVFDRVPSARDVPLKIVVESVKFLEDSGFSKKQIEAGFPILFYSHKILGDNFANAETVLGSDWREKDNALCLLNYLIEVEGNFSFDLIYDGITSCFNDGFSAELFSELSTAQNKEEGDDSEDKIIPGVENVPYENIPVVDVSPVPFLHPPASPAAASQRQFHSSGGCFRGNSEDKKVRYGDGKQVRRIFHIQSPLTMLKIHMKFLEVKQFWDPHLDRTEFMEGAKYAVVAVAARLGEGSWTDLKGLLTRKELKRLRSEVETKWSDVLRNNISLEVEQIQKIVIMDFRTQQIVDKKYCDIELVVYGVKERSGSSSSPLLVKVMVTLSREYTEGRLPDWIVSRFRVQDFDSNDTMLQ